MADSKITALTALTAADPVNDMFPVVDVSDTTMAASGTTKKISVNNILSSSPTASGALTVTGLVTAGSATITGAATVGTTLGVTGAATVTGAANLNGAVNLNLSGSSTVTLGSSTSYGVLQGSGTNPASIYINGANRPSNNALLQFGAAEHQFLNSSLATVWATINSTGLNVANGNVILGTSGKGIDFTATASGSGTMTSELLDDYEEGAFTPGVTFGGASVGMIGSFSGNYTKVGRVVTVNGIINITTRGVSTGTALITGLPFTSSNTSSNYTAVTLRLASISFTDTFQGFIQFNSTSINLEQITNAGTESVLTHSNFSAGSSFLMWNCTYTAD